MATKLAAILGKKKFKKTSQTGKMHLQTDPICMQIKLLALANK